MPKKRDPRSWSLWKQIYQSKAACRIVQRLSPRQSRYFLKYMLDESLLVRESRIKRFEVKP